MAAGVKRDAARKMLSKVFANMMHHISFLVCCAMGGRFIQEKTAGASPRPTSGVECYN